MIKLFSYIILILLFSACKSTKDMPSTSEQIPEFSTQDFFIQGENLSEMGIDAVGNIFLVEHERILKRYTKDGQFDKSYDAESVSYINSIDVNNGLYIMLFYRDDTSLSILDRNLALLNQVDYSQWTQDDITAASMSNDNNLWLYNNSKRKLQKFSTQGKLLIESLDIFGLTAFDTNISRILEHENKIYLTNDNNEIIQLDNLGRFIQDIPYKIESPLHGGKNSVCGEYQGKYACISLENRIIEEPLPVENIMRGSKSCILYNIFMFQLYAKGVVRTPIIF